MTKLRIVKKRQLRSLIARRRCQMLHHRAKHKIPLKKQIHRLNVVHKTKRHMLQRGRKYQWMKRERAAKRIRR